MLQSDRALPWQTPEKDALRHYRQSKRTALRVLGNSAEKPMGRPFAPNADKERLFVGAAPRELARAGGKEPVGSPLEEQEGRLGLAEAR